ncbi:MAG TPA: SRPBCC domain-containing protein [Candidatus Nitrosopolaris sp.]|nr:SRPBCC domain-containing protein [Candidatus Nitrosopolaris sp.]
MLTRTAVVRVDRDPDWVFRELHDPAALLSCVPGGRITRIFDDHRFEACVVAGVGPFKITYAGTGRIKDSDPRARSASLTIAGSGVGVPPAKVRMTMAIAEVGRSAELCMSFRVMLAGSRVSRALVDCIVGDLLDRTVRRIKVQLESRATY